MVCTASAMLLACRSRGIDVTIQNNGPATVRNLEVDYPGAAFGTDSIAPGSSFSYRIKPLSTGEVTLSFAQEKGGAFKQKGPTVRAQEEGRLMLILEQDANHQWRLRAHQQ
jgi:hypothetical protein